MPSQPDPHDSGNANVSSPLDPGAIAEQAAALAAHFERSGVPFLPRPIESNVASWQEQLAGSDPMQDAPEPLPADRVTESNVSSPSASPLQEPSLSSSPSEAAGIGASGKPASESAKPAATVRSSVPPIAASPNIAASPTLAGEPLPVQQRMEELRVIETDVSQCTACEILAGCRTQTVFGEGSADARFVFFGEGPGADEDRSGRPFVGRAGQLLTKMIEACTLSRAETYIFNTVKCRPPGNRNPEPDELENCRPFYQRQLQVIRPEYIVCLGAVAAQELLQTKLSVGRLRGQWHQYQSSKVLVTYHPAYLLRNPAAKKAAWEDLKRMLSDAGISV